MDLRVTVVGMPPCATEFHFCNIAGAFAARVALTETLFGCHAALRCGREALFLRPTMLFFFPYARAGLQARLSAGATPGVPAAHRFRSLLVMRMFGHNAPAFRDFSTRAMVPVGKMLSRRSGMIREHAPADRQAPRQ